jgi:Rrf2 family protein
VNLLSRRSILAVAAVTDIALHARPMPVSSKALSARLALPPRHLEPILQELVRQNVLKGLRGPRGGYELARERRRISVGDIVRGMSAWHEQPDAGSVMVDQVIEPLIRRSAATFLAELDAITVDDLCREAELNGVAFPQSIHDFTI